VALALFALLSGLRLLKPWGGGWPSWPARVVLVFAFARLAPFWWWPAAPGLEAAFPSSSTLLLVWRDGLPASYLPLYPILGFGLRDSGLATLAADVSLLAGLHAHRAFLLVALASEGLLTLALFALARRFWTEAWSAVGAVAATAVALLGVAGGDCLGGGVTMAMALTVAGAALVLRAGGRSPCVAAGVLWAGGAALSPLVVLVGGLATLAMFVARRGGQASGLIGLATLVAALLAAPVLWRTVEVGTPEPPGVLGSTLCALVVAGISATAGHWRRPGARSLALATSVVVAATISDWRLRSGRVLISADELSAAGWLRDHTEPTDVICSDDPRVRAWIPALAGRAASPRGLPLSVRPSRLAPALEACRFAWGPPGSQPWPVAFRQGRVSLARVPLEDGTDEP
jgi:hypothetical protein